MVNYFNKALYGELDKYLPGPANYFLSLCSKKFCLVQNNKRVFIVYIIYLYI